MAGRTARRARIRGGWAALGLLALGLAACGTPQPAADSPDSGQPATTAAESPASKETPAAAPEADRPAAASPNSGLRLPAPATPEVALAVPDRALPGPERLMGLNGDEVRALLGAPGFVRRDPPAEIWQYATGTCVLDLFLYAEGKGSPHRVSHFEFRGRTVEGVAPADCYRQLLAAHARMPAG